VIAGARSTPLKRGVNEIANQVRSKFVRLAGEELHEFGIDEELLAANGLFREQSDPREFLEIYGGGLPPGDAAPRSFMAKSSNFSGLNRKTVVTPEILFGVF
jgi:hypothetical protein